MAFQSAKNFFLTSAAQDLGLGDQLRQQLDDTLAQRRKLSGNPGFLDPALGSAAMRSLGLSTVNGTTGPV